MDNNQRKVLTQKRELVLQQAKAKKQKLFMQIGFPILIVVLIAGIFIFKSINENEDTKGEKTSSSGNTMNMPLFYAYKDVMGAEVFVPQRQ